MPEIKCEDCWWCGRLEQDKCDHPDTYAWSRDDERRVGNCGPEGKLFEPKGDHMDKIEVVPDLRGLCITCKQWCGDREANFKLYIKNPKSFSIGKGYAGEGTCKIDYAFMNVKGDACTTITFDANFGCNRWECF